MATRAERLMQGGRSGSASSAWSWPWSWPWSWSWNSVRPGRSFASLDYGLPLELVGLDQVELAVHTCGEGDPPIVLLHGLGSDMRVWSRNLAALSGRARVLAVDLPGFGKSSKPDVSYSLPWMAARVVELLDRCGLDRVVLCGHSMGGQIAMELALSQPERVAALLLAAPAGLERFSEAEGRWIRAAVDDDYTARASAATVVARYLPTFHRMPTAAWPLLRDRLAIIGGPDVRAYARAVTRSVAAMLERPVIDRLGALRMPVLVSFGSEDALVPNRMLHGRDTATLARCGVQRMPNATLAMVRGAGHMVQLERPDEWNAAALTFLARHVPRS
ncbi:MAG: alpha/beta fold hydrolase [Deltaproteobacteria bacterium]|nr:alpha/beta fold hydrolase [Deltaproteobacteria bacterium]MBK8714812.1 alpha/beta fold hydrolase [Deltaproteobacteria bacterium]